MAQIYGEPLPPDADLFTRRRRTGIGGSDSGDILGVGRYGCALSVWEEKRGLAPPREGKEIMTWGKRLEGPIRDGYAEDNGVQVRQVGFRRSKDHGFVIGHPDGEVIDPVQAPFGLEIKVVQHLGDQWGEAGTDEVPAHYYAQCQHYMLLMGWWVMDLPALVRARQMVTYTIPRNEAFIDAMLTEEAEFWHLVQTGTPPEPDGSESAGKVLRRMFPYAVDDSISIVATPAVAGYAQDYLDAKLRIEAAERDQRLAQQRIENFMGERKRLVGEGFTASWPTVKGRVSWKEVASGYRKMLADHDEDAGTLDTIEGLYRSEPSRRFGGVTVKEGDKA